MLRASRPFTRTQLRQHQRCSHERQKADAFVRKCQRGLEVTGHLRTSVKRRLRLHGEGSIACCGCSEESKRMNMMEATIFKHSAEDACYIGNEDEIDGGETQQRRWCD